MPDCEFCNHSFNTLGNLTRHKRTVKSCLKIQTERNTPINPYIFECEYCKVNFSAKIKLNNHIVICKKKSQHNEIVLLEKKIDQLQLQLNKYIDNNSSKKIIESSNNESIIEYSNNVIPITTNKKDKKSYAKTMKIEIDKNTFQTQLSHDIEKKDTNLETTDIEKKATNLEKKDINLETIDLEIAYRVAISNYKDNPTKKYKIVMNEQGHRIVCDILVEKLLKYRIYFQKTKKVAIPPILKEYPEKIEEYIYWLHEDF